MSAGRRPGLSAGLCAAFLCSGAAALLFETLWFRLTGLGLGNSVWASSVVLAAFMAGLALGNGLGARFGGRVPRPLVAFAALEGVVALLSLALVLALPALGAWLAPLLAGLQERTFVLNSGRAGLAFGLLLLPATAMGATLPLLTRALAPHSGRFGIALGRLYGWNTLGGVLGALASETLLVPRLGLTRTAFVAAALNLTALATALTLDRRLGEGARLEPAEPAVPGASARASSRALRLLSAAFLAGGILLALEVVWFRFLELFVFGTQLAFALMLSTVLAGIALGGLLAAAWLRRRAQATAALSILALLAGIAAATSYSAFDPAQAPLAGEVGRTLWLSLVLMLPASLLSGMLFTLQGAALREELSSDAAAAGWLTFANTLGAMLGAPLAGFVLLPALGLERSLFALAVSYGALSLLVLPWSLGRRPLRPVLLASAACFALVALLFPFGLLQGRFVRVLSATMAGDGARQVAFREGPTQTAILFQADWGGAPVYQQLVTNAHSMTSSFFYARRYMKLFAYWPLALQPDARRALLISYGLGNTAEALVLAPGLERIDVVDSSRTILELSPLVARAGAADPLLDARVRVHVEDGRFFLRARGEPYDVITAEPPPPHAAGVASLYSLEYFRLTRSRLAAGGIATHWLPVNQLPLSGARSIVRAFCAVFEDCSLWSGAGYDWMLAGSNGAAAVPEPGLRRPWADSAAGADLRGLAIEKPEQLGALFIADAPQLARWTAGEAPLVDDRPGRLGHGLPGPSELAAYRELQQPGACAERFLASEMVRRLWPPGLRERTLAWFAWQGVFNRDYEDAARPEALAELWSVLETTPLVTLPLLQLDSEPRIRATARARHLEGGVHPALAFHLGAAALADRDYDAAARFFAAAREAGHSFHSPRLMRALALGLAGRELEARLAVESVAASSLPPHAHPWRAWLVERLARGASPVRSRPAAAAAARDR